MRVHGYGFGGGGCPAPVSYRQGDGVRGFIDIQRFRIWDSGDIVIAEGPLVGRRCRGAAGLIGEMNNERGTAAGLIQRKIRPQLLCRSGQANE